MFLLNGQPLAIDVPFITEDGTQYPANWLRLASEEEKAAIGITEIEDPIRADDRFYWNGDINNPKDLDQIKAMLTSNLKAAAYSLLQPSDWKFIRKLETGQDVDAETLNYRELVRSAFSENEGIITKATSVDELASVQFNWPTN
jgi:hypothetical protein